MEMYVANCTRQNFIFNYRLSNEPGVKHIAIGIGQQQKVPGSLTQAMVDEILRQHKPYGMISVDEINRTKGFIGTCYSIDKKIKVDAIMKGLDHNESVLIERGREIRRAAAVQSNNMIENALHDANVKNNMDVKLDELEMIVEEADPKGRKQPDGLQEGITVTHSAGPTPVESAKPQRGRGKRQ